MEPIGPALLNSPFSLEIKLSQDRKYANCMRMEIFNLEIGTLYTFAASTNKPCCLKRFKWTKCKNEYGVIYINLASLCKRLNISRFKVIKNVFFRNTLYNLIFTCSEEKINFLKRRYEFYYNNFNFLNLSLDHFLKLGNFIEKVKENVRNHFNNPTFGTLLKSYVRLSSSFVEQETGVKRTLIFYKNGRIVIQVRDFILGMGNFKIVKPSVDYETGTIYAEAGTIAQKNLSPLFYKALMEKEEEALLSLQNSDHIVKIRECIYYPSKVGKPEERIKQKILMDYYENGSLDLYIEKNKTSINESHLLSIMRQISAGIKAIHIRDIVIKDIKISNCLVDRNGKIFICDFGMAYSGLYKCGSLGYYAPEVKDLIRMGVLQDIFSFGVLLYLLYTQDGSFPFNVTSDDCYPTIENRNERFISFRNEIKIEGLILKMLDFNPSNRPSIFQIEENLNNIESFTSRMLI